MPIGPFEHITRIRREKYGLDEHGNLNKVNPLATDLRDSIDRLAQGLYTRNAHFIFELIQNAEDNEYCSEAEPSLTFKLLKSDPTNTPGADGALIVENNEEGFLEENVYAICAVGKSTKKSHQGYIGEKGIGFKSVFRVTSIPFIFSNGYQVSLSEQHEKTGLGYIVPEWVENIPTCIKLSSTSIVLPLDKPDFGYETVKEMLKDIEPETILFLSKIKELNIETGDSEGFSIIKDDKSKPFIQLLSNKNGNYDIYEYILFKKFFDKPAQINHEKRSGVNQREVSIVFPINDNSNSAGKLFAYLPVKFDTGFPFIINADFILTSSREDIQDIPWNRDWLMHCVGKLVSSSLPILKEKKQITVPFLQSLAKSVLTLREDDMYFPIAEKLKEAFANLELLPADDGSFVSAENAKLASAAWLRQSLQQDQLKLLFQKDLKWIHGDITEKRHELWKYMRDHLKIEEVTPDSFARKVDSAFFENQSDQWMIDFYAQLPSQKTLWKNGSGTHRNPDGPLRKKPFIRLQDNSHVKPLDDDDKPNAYLPANTLIDYRLPTVKEEIANCEDARRFLISDLKIPEFDIVAEVIEHVLPKYNSPSPPQNKEHMGDIDKIIRAFQTDSQEKLKRLKVVLKKTPFIISKLPFFDDEIYRCPDKLYYKNDSLERYFSGNTDVGFISSRYQKSALEMFDSLGVRHEVRIDKRKPDNQGYISIEDSHGRHERGLYGFDPSIEVEGLSIALSTSTKEKSLFIWNKIVCPNADCIRGTVEKSSRQFYENSSKEERVSELFGRLLMESNWLPGPNGRFYSPSELNINDLPDQFERNEKIADLLGMRKTEKVKAADILSGGNPRKRELIEQIANASDDELNKFGKFFPRQNPPTPPPSFSAGLEDLVRLQRSCLSTVHEYSEDEENYPVRNPERYQDRCDEKVDNAFDDHSKKPQTISFTPVRDKPDNKEAREFLYNEYQGRCQITGETFPKASANAEGFSENYFEACSLLPYSNADYLNDSGNMLCVSADTMAKLKHASFEWLDEFKDKIAEFRDKRGTTQFIGIKVKLAGEECTITWSQRHFMRLVSLYKQT